MIASAPRCSPSRCSANARPSPASTLFAARARATASSRSPRISAALTLDERSISSVKNGALARRTYDNPSSIARSAASGSVTDSAIDSVKNAPDTTPSRGSRARAMAARACSIVASQSPAPMSRKLATASICARSSSGRA
jgi:hypothetical protein